METKKKVSTWGSSRYGGGQATLLTISIVGGAALSLLVGWGIVSFRQEDLPGWALPVVSLPVWPVVAAIIWALLVDRSTLKGGNPKSEHSVENHWFAQAAENTFYIMIAGMGLSSGLMATLGWEVPGDLALTVATESACIIFILYYLFYRRRGV
ncbi:hypothetical protein ACN082_09020 [Rothia sp. CCM 9417]|uniref:hypothetical protein n=1 Tax=Rothia sp. CCM 9417 TaxID=3402657 RepID=UPI003AD9F37C